MAIGDAQAVAAEQLALGTGRRRPSQSLLRRAASSSGRGWGAAAARMVIRAAAISLPPLWGMLLIAALLLRSAGICHAAELTRARTEKNVDWISTGVGGLGAGTGTLNLSGVSGTIKLALLYWHGIDRPAQGGDGVYDNPQVSFAGEMVTGVAIGDGPTNCWPKGPPQTPGATPTPAPGSSRAYRADVTSLVTGNGNYAIGGLAAETGHDGNGASLVVVFDDGDPLNDHDLIIYEGNDANVADGYPGEVDGWAAALDQISYTGGAVSAELHVADGQQLTDDVVTFSTGAPAQEELDTAQRWDGMSVPDADHGRATDPGEEGSLWDIHRFDVSGLFTGAGMHTLTISGQVETDDCVALILALVELQATQPTPTATPTETPVPPTVTTTATTTNSPALPTVIETPSATPSPTRTAIPTSTRTGIATTTITAGVPATATATGGATATHTQGAAATASATAVATSTGTPGGPTTATATQPPTPSATDTPVGPTAIPTSTDTPGGPATATATSQVATATVTDTAAPPGTSTATHTPGSPAPATATHTAGGALTATATAPPGTPPPTASRTAAATVTATAGPQGTATATASGGPATTTSTATPTAEPACIFPCTGDCNGNCEVAINELILMVNLALSDGDVTGCLAGDPNGDRRVSIDEIVAAVNRALNGCPRAAG